MEKLALLVTLQAKLGKEDSLANYSQAQLQELLEQALAKEDYQLAVKIRDFMKKKNNDE